MRVINLAVISMMCQTALATILIGYVVSPNAALIFSAAAVLFISGVNCIAVTIYTTHLKKTAEHDDH